MPEQRFVRLKELFRKAEDRSKEAEILNDALSVPTLNELRYVAFHLTHYLSTDNSTEKETHLSEAESHCRRAYFDASMIVVDYYLGIIKEFRTRYQYIPIGSVIPGYIDKLKTIKEIEVATSQYANGSHPEKEKFCEELSNYIIPLRDIWNVFDLSREEINKKAAIWFIGIVIAFLSMIAGILKLIL